MKKSVPLYLGAMMLSLSSFAQQNTVSEKFENGLEPLTSSCWILDQVKYAAKADNKPEYLMQGAGSEGNLYALPPVNSTNFRSLSTPLLDVGNSVTVTFDYQQSSKLKFNATHVLKVYLVGLNGAEILVGKRDMDDKSAVTKEVFEESISVTPGIYRVRIDMGGTLGDGASRLLLDNLDINASYHYKGGCNSAPIASDDNFTTIKGSQFTDNVLTNDVEPDSEAMTAVLVSNSADGTVTLNPDGTFTFVPADGFTGTSTTFTYQVVDNGHPVATSNPATVTLNFTEPITSVLTIVSFDGSIANHTLKLEWEVGMNELIEYFEIEQSTNGVKFDKVAEQVASTRAGNERYNRSDRASNNDQLYRLKVVGKNGTITYSEVVMVKAPRPNNSQSLTILNNPVGSTLQFRYNADNGGKVVIAVINSGTGAQEFSAQRTAQKGANNMFFFNEASTLRPGNYLLTVTTESGEVFSTPFLKM